MEANEKEMRPPAHNPKGINQWSKKKTPGEREKLEKWRERYKAHGIIQTLHDHGQGKVDLSPTQIKALEIVLDRLEPRLSAVEQTTVDPGRSEADIMQELRLAIDADPSFKTQLQALIDGRPVEVSTNKADTPNPGQPDSHPISKTGS